MGRSTLLLGRSTCALALLSLVGCGSGEEGSTTTSSSSSSASSSTTGSESTAMGNPYAKISDASPELLANVLESYKFIATIHHLMDGYQPELPTVPNPDLLRCMTEEAKIFDPELKRLDKKFAKDVKKAQKEKDKIESDFYKIAYPVQFRIDQDWEGRIGLREQLTYGCLDTDDWDWWDDTSQAECDRSYTSWRVRYRKWVEDEAINLYSRTETPAKPELMQRMAAANVTTPERVYCMVGEVTHKEQRNYACWQINAWESEYRTRSQCRDAYRGEWKVRSTEPGDYATVSCVGPSGGQVVADWLVSQDLIDEEQTEEMASLIDGLSGDASEAFAGFQESYALRVPIKEATGALIGDIVSAPLSSVTGVETGSVYAEFDLDARRLPPPLTRWTSQTLPGTMKIEGNGTCPPANEISAALCRNANYRSDKNSVVANCVEGEDLEKLAEHVKGWEKQGFKEKESIMVSAYGAITKTSDDWSHKVQLANYQLRSKDEAGATTTLNAVATGCEDKAVLTKAAKLAGKAGLDELKTSLTTKAENLDAIE